MDACDWYGKDLRELYNYEMVFSRDHKQKVEYIDSIIKDIPPPPVIHNIQDLTATEIIDEYKVLIRYDTVYNK